MIKLRCHTHLVPWFLGSMVQHQQQGVRLHQFQCHNFHRHHHMEARRHILFVVEGGEISTVLRGSAPPPPLLLPIRAPGGSGSGARS